MSYNPTLPLRLDAYPVFRGTSFHAKGNITDKFMRDADRFTLQSGREIGFSKSVIGDVTVPVVAPVATLVPLLQYYSSLRFGMAVAPYQFLVETINTTTDIVTITAHPFAAADAVYLRAEETFPTLGTGSLDNGTVYYVGNITTNTFKLYTNSTHATAGSGASLVDFSAAGTGAMWVAREFPLVINRRSGVARTWLNAAPIKFPSLTANGGKLFWEGDLGFRAYPKIGGAIADGLAAFYTEATAAYTSPTWDASGILTTQTLTAAWGGSAPWSAMFGENGAAITFEPQLKEQGNGVWAHVTDSLEGFKCTIRLKPIGITVPQLAALFTEMPGAQLTANNLVLTFGGYTWTFYNATLVTPKEVIFSAKDTVSPELEFEAFGNATSDNKPGFLIA